MITFSGSWYKPVKPQPTRLITNNLEINNDSQSVDTVCKPKNAYNNSFKNHPIQSLSFTSKPYPYGAFVALSSSQLLPGCKNNPIKNFADIKKEQLMVVHLQDNIPTNGSILNAHDLKSVPRYTTHFSLNHSANDFAGPNATWKNCKVAIMLPYSEAEKLNGEPAGGTEEDLFWADSFNIDSPKTIMFIKDETVPEGFAKVTDPVRLGFKPNFKPLILSTAMNPHSAVTHGIKKAGFTNLPVHHLNIYSHKEIDQLLEDPKALKTYLTQQNAFRAMFQAQFPTMDYGAHDKTLYGKIEEAFSIIAGLAMQDAEWISVPDREKNPLDWPIHMKKVVASYFDSIDTQNHTLPFDPAEVVEIINESDSPMNAAEKINKKLKLNPKVMPHYSSYDACLLYADNLIGFTKKGKSINDVFKTFFSKPQLNKDDLKSISKALKLFELRAFERSKGIDFSQALQNYMKILSAEPSPTKTLKKIDTFMEHGKQLFTDYHYQQWEKLRKELTPLMEALKEQNKAYISFEDYTKFAKIVYETSRKEA